MFSVRDASGTVTRTPPLGFQVDWEGVVTSSCETTTSPGPSLGSLDYVYHPFGLEGLVVPMNDPTVFSVFHNRMSQLFLRPLEM